MKKFIIATLAMIIAIAITHTLCYAFGVSDYGKGVFCGISGMFVGCLIFFRLK